MRLPGYCTTCHRPRRVRVSGHDLALYASRARLYAQGICDECETNDQTARAERFNYATARPRPLNLPDAAAVMRDCSAVRKAASDDE